jgi:adenosylcobinamide amidohydrolase
MQSNKFKRYNRHCNVVVSKEFEYMQMQTQMTACRRKANTTRNKFILFQKAIKFQESQEG